MSKSKIVYYEIKMYDSYDNEWYGYERFKCKYNAKVYKKAHFKGLDVKVKRLRLLLRINFVLRGGNDFKTLTNHHYLQIGRK